jgi:hypothetical protein
MAKKRLAAMFSFLWFIVLLHNQAGVQAAGLIRIHPTNSRYVTDESGKAIYLVGSHERNNFQLATDAQASSEFHYDDYLNLLKEYKHNFIRLWVWEHARWNPLPYQRTGPGIANDGQLKFDLNQFDQTYFDALRARVIAAGLRGIYVGVMLFQGWSVANGSYARGYVAWDFHPLHAQNNVNGINGDVNGDGEGREVHTLQTPIITELQKAYVRKVIDTLNDLDNFIWEISNESPPESLAWQDEMIRFVRTYEADKRKQHLMWLSALYGGPAHSVLFESAADVVSPAANEVVGLQYREDPPPSDGKKIIINDTDHLGSKSVLQQIWKSFIRGINFIFLDKGLNALNRPFNPEARGAMRDTISYAERMNLAAALPLPRLSSTSYVLANPGSEYLFYQPSSGPFTVELKKNTYHYEWFDPWSGKIVESGTLSARDGKQDVRPPFNGEAVLYLKTRALE